MSDVYNPLTDLEHKINQHTRTIEDAVAEAEQMIEETLVRLSPDNPFDSWFMTRLTKIAEALADRPK